MKPLLPFLVDLTAGLSLLYVLVVSYFWLGWKRLRKPIPPQTLPDIRISVLIAARNEEQQIGDTIHDILSQDYPAGLFELIVVDDHSTDRTAEVVTSFAAQGVKLIRLMEEQPLNSYKKKAIASAIEVSQGELIVATDADCRMGPAWLKTMAALYKAGNVLISGPVVYHQEQNHFEKLQTLEFLYLIGLGASTIGNRTPATCNGANLAYCKSVFYEVGGFNGIDHLASGDDELLLHKVAERYPEQIAFCKTPAAIVYTTAKPTLRDFIRQRKRWASKSTKYKNKMVVIMGVLIWSFNVCLLLSLFLSLFFPWLFGPLAVIWSIKLLAEGLFLWPVCQFAQRKSLLWYLPTLTVIHVLYMAYIGIAGNTGKYEWKGRWVR
ncbi:Glycosyltransferase, catalytic subunit of cellulose synthase and poly-beta-1,6-N-acetylglucosamine synthase [bacterium A37T11]|nr:Glycosyltransferase, catalytic subunit of cellulose synthase and poly-beta-1,6-N-acetylglucosamine synthase [bacterium A37T11]